MKKVKYVCCSQKQVERYLLNRMSADEETHFQEHLEECVECRAYMDVVRTLSKELGSDELQFPDTTAVTEEKKPRKFNLHPIISMAAAILLIVGISFYLYKIENGDEGLDRHDTYINSNPSKANIMEMPFELLLPNADTLLLNKSDTPLVFKWNREVAYSLVLRTGKRTIKKINSFGDSYTPEAKDIDGCASIDWILTVENEKLKGHIIFMK